MTPFQIAAILIVLAALFSYINYLYIHLPTTIGVMLIALVASLAMIALGEAGALGHHVRDRTAAILGSIDFYDLVVQEMLAFLLFAGALHIDLRELGRQKGAIAVLATLGLGFSTIVVGALTWSLLRVMGMGVSFFEALLFGALISPTDPIAVLGIMRKAGAPKSLEMKICGESLFNDGIGVVFFLVLLRAASGGNISAGHLGWLLIKEAIGGALFGLAAGYIAYHMLKRVDDYVVEVLLTLALVTGGYALANAIHVSGPIAIVVAGLLVGNPGRALAMSKRTRQNLDTFWELIDAILNAVLFVLIGLEVLIMPLTWRYLLVGAAVIPIILLARWVSVGATVTIMSRRRPFSPGTISILTWGGLRGGLSVAMALSLPIQPGDRESGPRTVIVAMTYAVVVFSIVVQGLTIGRLVQRKLRGTRPEEQAEQLSII